VFVNRYFASLNYTQSIVPFLDQFYWDFVPGIIKKKTDIFIAKAEADLQDDLF